MGIILVIEPKNPDLGEPQYLTDFGDVEDILSFTSSIDKKEAFVFTDQEMIADIKSQLNSSWGSEYDVSEEVSSE